MLLSVSVSVFFWSILEQNYLHQFAHSKYPFRLFFLLLRLHLQVQLTHIPPVMCLISARAD